MRDAGCGMPQTKTTRAGMLLSEQSSPRECPRPTEATKDTSCRCYLRGPDGVRRLSPSGTWDPSNIAGIRVDGSRSATGRDRSASGHHSVVLGLLEKRQSTLIRVRVEKLRQGNRTRAFRGGQETDRRPNHRVAKTKNVDARDAVPNIRVCARKISEYGIAPICPIAGDELLPCLLRRELGKRVIVGPDSALLDRAERLMGRHDIAQSG